MNIENSIIRITLELIIINFPLFAVKCNLIRHFIFSKKYAYLLHALLLRSYNFQTWLSTQMVFDWNDLTGNLLTANYYNHSQSLKYSLKQSPDWHSKAERKN